MLLCEVAALSLRSTSPSGLLQLGARFYSPQIGRFIQQDPTGSGINWYTYAGNNPVVFIDPDGLDLTIPGLSGQPFLVFDEGSGEQLGMSAGATLSGLAAGATLGLWQPDWTHPCDAYAGFSKGMGTMSGGALAVAAGIAAAEKAGVLKFPEHAGGFELNLGRNFRAGWHKLPARVKRWAGRSLPHYHRRYPGPGGGIGRHRPWEGW